MERIKKLLNSKILCIYYGGSYAYKTVTDDSDIDYMVITDDKEGFRSIAIEEDGIKHEYFVLGKDRFNEIEEIAEEANTFSASHADTILACRDRKNILYLDDEYKDEFLSLVDTLWSKDKIGKMLIRFSNYYKLMTDLGLNIKKHYHVYRLRAMLDSYDETGSFSLDYKEPYKTKMYEYKSNFRSIPYVNKEIKKLLLYIKEYGERLIGN